jgi:hypothetical protein
VYGASSTGIGNSRGFVWDAAHGMRDLMQVLTTDYGVDLAGWHQVGVAAVSDDGLTLAGNGINPAGGIEGFVLVLPEPACFLVLLAASSLWLGRGRRRDGRPGARHAVPSVL